MLLHNNDSTGMCTTVYNNIIAPCVYNVSIYTMQVPPTDLNFLWDPQDEHKEYPGK